MAQWDFSLGSAGTGHLTVTENWNSSYQVSLHARLWVDKSGSWFSNSGGNWNANIGGVTGSGGFNYASGSQTYTLWTMDYTFNKDANGNIGVGCYGFINGDNSPGVGAGSTSQTYYAARVPAGPTITVSACDTITDTSVRLYTEISNNGTGTNSATRFYYKKPADGSYAQTGDQNDVGGYNYFNVVGLTPNTTYQFFARWWNNNGDTSNAGVSTFKTLGNATGTANNILATTFDVPVTVTASGSGEVNPTTKVQYRKTGDTTWIDGPSTTSLSATLTPTGLLPNTQYDYRLAVTNSTGTYTGAVQTVTTLPAGKLIYPDGTLKNAIPRLVNDDGTVTMLNISEINPA